MYCSVIVITREIITSIVKTRITFLISRIIVEVGQKNIPSHISTASVCIMSNNVVGDEVVGVLNCKVVHVLWRELPYFNDFVKEGVRSIFDAGGGISVIGNFEPSFVV